MHAAHAVHVMCDMPAAQVMGLVIEDVIERNLQGATLSKETYLQALAVRCAAVLCAALCAGVLCRAVLCLATPLGLLDALICTVLWAASRAPPVLCVPACRRRCHWSGRLSRRGAASWSLVQTGGPLFLL